MQKRVYYKDWLTEKRTIELVSLLIFIMYFREPIFAVLNLRSLSKFLVFAPHAIFLFFLDFKKINISSVKQIPYFTFLAFLVIFSFINLVGIFLFEENSSSIAKAINYSQNIFIYQITPMLLLLTKIKDVQIKRIFQIITFPLLLLFTIYIFIEFQLIHNYNMFSIYEVREWLFNSPPVNKHIPGFLGTIQSSTMTIVAFCIFHLSKTLIENKKVNYKLVLNYLLLLFVHYTVGLSYSITNLTLLIGFSSLLILYWGYKNQYKILSFLLTVPLVISFYTSGLLGKLMRYISPLQYSENFTYRELTLYGFTPTFLLPERLKEFQHEVDPGGELHLFSATRNIGFFADIPRLILIFAPLFLLYHFKKQGKEEDTPIFLFVFSLLLGSFHYPNVTEWPNIFIYILALYFVSSKVSFKGETFEVHA